LPKKNIDVYGTKEFVILYKKLNPNDQLKKPIDDAMDLMKANPTIGDRIEKRLWPRQYVRKYDINNLFRYEIGSNYRLIYTIVSDSNRIVCLLLDVLSHKDYDKLFGYQTS
jgi:mRNA-degrading endonuclease RelE of RelBE toxin-antitoxin system